MIIQRTVIRTYSTLLLLLYVSVATSSSTPAAQTASQVYSDNEKGLRKLISDMLRMAEKRQEQDFSSLASSLVLPNQAEWFARTFGAESGGAISRSYSQVSGNLPGNLLPGFTQLVANRFKEVHVRRAVTPCVPGISLDHLRVLAAQQAPTPLYVVTARNGDQSRSIGFFVFVDSAFRWIGNLRLGQRDDLPRANVQPMARIDQAGPYASAVPPVYPPEARKARTQGTIRLSAIITREGTIRELYYQDGPCVLAESAMDAVRQWRYKPTVLNGQLIEASTTIDVVFTLSN